MPFANLTIDRIILHEIYKRGPNRELQPPKYSQGLTILDQPGLATLQSRIVAALGSGSHSIEMSIERDGEDSVFQKAAKCIRCEEAGFIAHSQILAGELAQRQTSRRLPGGIVVVFNGTIGTDPKRTIGIMKAEIHEGFNTERDEGRVSMKFLSDLLLTPYQKMYKIGIFVEQEVVEDEDALRSPHEFKALVYDHNMNKAETQQAAMYFYDSYLGCSISPTAKKLTRDFYEHTRGFIQTLDKTDEEKKDLNFCLYTYLKMSQAPTISAEDFAMEYLGTPEVKDSYSRHMRGKGFPETAIVKDITYIKNKLKMRGLTFSSKIKILGPSEGFNDMVVIEGVVDGRTIVSIQGQVEDQV